MTKPLAKIEKTREMNQSICTDIHQLHRRPPVRSKIAGGESRIEPCEIKHQSGNGSDMRAAANDFAIAKTGPPPLRIVAWLSVVRDGYCTGEDVLTSSG
ncbi:hypothetical protein SH528x_003458 [Novipirellula sp. SH528]|uniref:hypothetical protein n=1 Tax=Novipirellula sp. SH528 TaxID=3454466 RepID=UPI003FA0F8CB